MPATTMNIIIKMNNNQNVIVYPVSHAITMRDGESFEERKKGTNIKSSLDSEIGTIRNVEGC